MNVTREDPLSEHKLLHVKLKDFGLGAERDDFREELPPLEGDQISDSRRSIRENSSASPTERSDGRECGYIPVSQSEIDLRLNLKQMYDPRSYLLGDLTPENVYSSCKSRELCTLAIEKLPEDATVTPVIVTPVIVTHVESPELFYVTPLQSRNLDALNALNDSLTLLYSGKTDLKVGDRTTKKLFWAMNEDAKLDNVEHMEKEAKLSDTQRSDGRKMEFAKGDFCAAKYAITDASNATSVVWYRAMVIEVIRKLSTKKVFKYVVVYVDYGNVEEVQVKCVRLLPARFLALPAQSIPCYLPEIQPRSTNSTELESEDDEEDTVTYRGRYDRSATTSFRDLILNKRVYVSVLEQGDIVTPMYYGYDKDRTQEKDCGTLLGLRSRCLPVTMGDQVKNKMVNIPLQLVNSGHADLTIDLGANSDSHRLTEVTCPVSSCVINDDISRLHHRLDDIVAMISKIAKRWEREYGL